MRRRHHERARPIRRLVAGTVFTAATIAVAAVGSLPAGGQVIEPSDVLLDFEDLPDDTDGDVQVISYTEVTDFYLDRGITFDPPVLGFRVDASQALELASFAASGSGFIAPRCPESVFLPQAAPAFETCPAVAMRFDTEMSAVSVFVGAAPSNENRTLTLEALDADGEAIADVSVDFPETGDLTPMETPLTVTVDDGDIFGARLYWINGSTTAFFVDDLGLTPFVGIPDIEARESTFELTGTTAGDDSAGAVSVTVIFDNIGTGPSFGHRIELVASEPFADGPLRFETIQCPDPLDRGGSCTVSVILDPGRFPLVEPGDYTGVAELSFVGSNGEILQAVDLDVGVVVLGSESTVTATTAGGNTESSVASTSSTLDPGPIEPPRPESDPPALVWLLLGALAVATVWVVRRVFRRTPPPPPPPPPPSTAPPPPPMHSTPVSPPYEITVRNTAGRQHLTRGDGPLVILTATRPPGRVDISETTGTSSSSAVSVTEGHSP